MKYFNGEILMNIFNCEVLINNEYFNCNTFHCEN